MCHRPNIIIIISDRILSSEADRREKKKHVISQVSTVPAYITYVMYARSVVYNLYFLPYPTPPIGVPSLTVDWELTYSLFQLHEYNLCVATTVTVILTVDVRSSLFTMNIQRIRFKCVMTLLWHIYTGWILHLQHCWIFWSWNSTRCGRSRNTTTTTFTDSMTAEWFSLRFFSIRPILLVWYLRKLR